MFVAAGASGAVGADAGFADFGQGALDSGPELLELAQEVLAERRIGGFWVRHAVCILYDIHTSQEKNERICDARFPAVTEALRGWMFVILLLVVVLYYGDVLATKLKRLVRSPKPT